MEHFPTLRTKWDDPELLILTPIHLNLKVKINADVRMYMGQKYRCDVVYVLQGDYDLGYSHNSDGTYDLVSDLWGLAKQYNQTQLINCINGTGAALTDLKRNGDLKKYLTDVAFYREGWYLEQEWIDKLAQVYRKKNEQ